MSGWGQTMICGFDDEGEKDRIEVPYKVISLSRALLSVEENSVELFANVARLVRQNLAKVPD